MAQSILARLDPSQISHQPYPHLHSTECLDPAHFAELSAAYPTLEKVLAGRPLKNNYAYLMQARSVFEDPEMPAIWRDFFAYHTSRAFFEEFLEFWRDAIASEYPDIEARFGKPLSELSTEVRYPGKKGTPENRSADVMLDCQFGVNSAVTSESVVRGPHIDDIHKLFNALLYFRRPEDESQGGDFVIYRPKAKSGHFLQDGRRDIEDRYVEPVLTVPYRANTLIMMINTSRSIHGVSPRSVTVEPRQYVNFHAETYRLSTDGFFPIRRSLGGRVATRVRRLVGARNA
ncbi:MAG: hypothetical protein QNJ30_01940 [Kiloniellales bacterium]|nr:hypothetical protein [Kiloniellales bacterium]